LKASPPAGIPLVPHLGISVALAPPPRAWYRWLPRIHAGRGAGSSTIWFFYTTWANSPRALPAHKFSTVSSMLEVSECGGPDGKEIEKTEVGPAAREGANLQRLVEAQPAHGVGSSPNPLT